MAEELVCLGLLAAASVLARAGERFIGYAAILAMIAIEAKNGER